MNVMEKELVNEMSFRGFSREEPGSFCFIISQPELGRFAQNDTNIKEIFMSRTFKTFLALVQRDMAVFWPTWKDRFINATIWGAMTVVVFEYIMPDMGLKGMGQFIACGAIASWGFFEVTENIAKFIADLEGQRSISYYLTLPIPQWVVFARLAVTNAFQAMFISILFLPIFKLLLRDAFPFTHFSLGRFIVIFLLIHLFYGFFSLYIAAKMKNLDELGNVWLRIVYPLWWMGCFQFSWATLKTVSPRTAQIDLLNPIVYAMEGMRSAVMGPADYLNFSGCCGALILFTVIAGYIGISRLQKRLDCI